MRKNRLQREDIKTSDCPTCIEMPFRSMIAAFFPSVAIVLQMWQLLEAVNGRSNIHTFHFMLFVVIDLFLLLVAEVAIVLSAWML